MTKTIIITAGGTGKRMGSSIPKQFIEINGLPILMHTINQFYSFDSQIEIIVVLPEMHLLTWKKLLKKHQFPVCHHIVSGGKERFHSIKNGLELATGKLIGVHDAVRPFVSQKVIKNCFEALSEHKAVIPVVDLKESIRKVENQQSFAVDRSVYKIVQTPQCFRSDVIKKAYLQPYSINFTDDASVVEKLGTPIHLVNGNDTNIKITTPVDLEFASLIIKSLV
jgi:2-C-methyl-D-erythritol 4-phosphate cytidylyltransferase